MKSKSEAYHTLLKLFHWHRAPISIVCNNVREFTMGKLQKKCIQADVHLKPLEPYTPWANKAKSAIQELKRGAKQKLTNARALSLLWDYEIELETKIRSHTTHGHYQLDRQVPATYMFGLTANILEIAEFKFYHWVKFCNVSPDFSESNKMLAQYLGPLSDVCKRYE